MNKVAATSNRRTANAASPQPPNSGERYSCGSAGGASESENCSSTTRRVRLVGRWRRRDHLDRPARDRLRGRGGRLQARASDRPRRSPWAGPPRARAGRTPRAARGAASSTFCSSSFFEMKTSSRRLSPTRRLMTSSPGASDRFAISWTVGAMLARISSTSALGDARLARGVPPRLALRSGLLVFDELADHRDRGCRAARSASPRRRRRRCGSRLGRRAALDDPHELDARRFALEAGCRTPRRCRPARTGAGSPSRRDGRSAR